MYMNRQCNWLIFMLFVIIVLLFVVVCYYCFIICCCLLLLFYYLGGNRHLVCNFQCSVVRLRSRIACFSCCEPLSPPVPAPFVSIAHPVSHKLHSFLRKYKRIQCPINCTAFSGNTSYNPAESRLVNVTQ
jgi:hypothetical protein